MKCSPAFPAHEEGGAALGDLIHRKRSPFPLRGEGEAARVRLRVGRDALIPPQFYVGANRRSDLGIAPYAGREARAAGGKTFPAGAS